jgi:hypothetical protein
VSFKNDVDLNTARTGRFKLLRDLKAVEKEIGRKVQIVELAIAFEKRRAISPASLTRTCEMVF